MKVGKHGFYSPKGSSEQSAPTFRPRTHSGCLFLKEMLRSFLILCLLSTQSLAVFGQGLFEANEGQWTENFAFRLRLNFGAVFFDESGFLFHLQDRPHAHGHEEMGTEAPHAAFRLHFQNAASIRWSGEEAVSTAYNYFLGKDPKRWKSGLHPHRILQSNEFLPGIRMRLSAAGDGLKYDFLLAAGAEPTELKYHFEGVESVRIRKGRLQIETGVGQVDEYIPECYQWLEGQKAAVDCRYLLHADGSIGFELGNYRSDLPLVIDPVLVFSSFSGSSADNWGFTATYDELGHAYGGGIAFGAGYPTALGVFQSGFGGGVIDIAITKFSPNGDQALYATYIGGSGNEQPHSLVVDQQGDLVVLGITGSNDFPVDPQGYQAGFQGGSPIITGSNYTFSIGTDLVLAKLNEDGTQLLGGTYFGGSLNDGVNDQFSVNYADEFRGEVQIDQQNHIYLASVTQSADVPLTGASQSSMGGWQDALIASFSSDLQSLRWGTYYGGNMADNANALDITQDGSLYAVGGTRSTNLNVSPNALGPSLSGNSDGFVLQLNASSGAHLGASFIGSPSVDQLYFVETDRYGSVYLLGQSFGNMPVSPGVFSSGAGGQFLQKINGSMDQLLWSTVIGNGNQPNMSPSAFMVDDCLNIYLSGWGGATNTANLGDMNNMPISPDAFQDSTDGSDFYFMVLEENARALQFATYFGGTANEHVDAGTSRFSPDGTIYQAVCAGCAGQTFPTTAGVYQPNNQSQNCNLGLIKIDFESSVRSDALLDPTFLPDTVCDTIRIKFQNNSSNANRYFWDFGNGQTSTDSDPVVRLHSLGTYNIMLVAFDTLCNSSDTAYLQIDHTQGSSTRADFSFQAVSCNPDRPVRFTNSSRRAQQFEWDFGDGALSSDADPQHIFTNFGSYTVRMIASDTLCGTSDTAEYSIDFLPVSLSPSISVQPPECGTTKTRLQIAGASDSLQVDWVIPGLDSVSGSSEWNYAFPYPGSYLIRTRILDTVCGDFVIYDTLIEVDDQIERLFVPNVFTPNGDGKNERFELYGDECFDEGHLLIFNRWGGKVFETRRPLEEFWDGSEEDASVKSGVYQWLLINREEKIYGFVTVLY